MSAPIFRDPVYDGATDPTVIRNEHTGQWWMFYTQRRTTDVGPRHRWVHGTEIGVAVSTDGGTTWTYRGVVEGLERGNTLWAPEVIRAPDGYRMYLTVVDGVPADWDAADAHIVEYRSSDLSRWRRIGTIDLGSERVIDAAVARSPDGLWRLWYKDERDESSTRVATSPDLENWTVEGRAVPASPPHEGPNVFRLGGWWWLITDEWRGLGVHRSVDAVHWSRQKHDNGLILAHPGSHPDDQEIGHHADALSLSDAHAVLFYFTHPRGSRPGADAGSRRRSAIHVARLSVRNGELIADRDVSAPVSLDEEGPDTPSAAASVSASPTPTLVARERTPSADPDVYGPALAYSLHLTAEVDGEVEWFNRGNGVAFAKGAAVGDDIRETRTLRHPYAFRTASGWLAVSALAGPEGEPLPDEAGTVLVHSSDDLLTWSELTTVRLGTEALSTIWGVYDTLDEAVLLCWREAGGIERTVTLRSDGAVDGSSLVSGWPVLPHAGPGSPPDSLLTETELCTLRSLSRSHPGASQDVRETEPPFVPFIRDRADPCILRYRGEYLFIATDDTDGRNVRARGLLARRAPMISGLRDAAEHQIMRLDGRTPPGCYWAPEFHELAGRLHCFFAMGVGGPEWTDVQCQVMTLREGGDPLDADDWGRPRPVLQADGTPLQRDPWHPGISLDMTCFTVADRTYAVWSQRYLTERIGDAELWISTIDPVRPDRLLTDPVRIAVPEYGWETNDANVVEGPFALQHDGRVFLAYSAAGVGARYAVGLLDAPADADLLDAVSWRKRGHPLYCSDPDASQWGPGHNSFVVDDDSDELLFVYHAKTGVHDVGRHTALRTVLWDETGAPVVGPLASAALVVAQERKAP